MIQLQPQSVLDLLLDSLRPNAASEGSACELEEPKLTRESLELVRPPVSVERLTSAQRRVADFLLSEPEDAAFLPAAAIAKRCGVSESSVVRFAAACGMSGFPQLQRTMQRLLRDRLSLTERVGSVVAVRNRGESILQRVIGADQRSLEQTLKVLDPDEFSAAVSRIIQARKIHVLGLRTSAALATMLAITLRYIGRDAAVVELGIGDYWERLSFVQQDDVLLVLSFRAYTRWTQEISRHVHALGVPIVLITDSLLAPAASLASAKLVVHRAKGAIVESSTAAMSVINALAVAVAQEDEERSIRSLRSMEELWEKKGLHERRTGVTGREDAA